MTTRIGNFLYLGNFGDVDTDDSNVDIEQPELLGGQTVTPQVVEITEVDGGDDGIIHIDNYTTQDDISYDLGSGTVTTDLDSVPRFNVDILLGDGSIMNQNVTLLQFTNGDVFTAGADFDNLTIQSITILTLTSPLHGYMVGSAFTEGASVVCFASDTAISTPTGQVRALDLRVGDTVETGFGAKTIKWINAAHHDHPGAQAPIIFKRGAMADNVPHKGLRLSPQHRVLIESNICLDMCGHRAVLVSARSLLPLNGVRQARPDTPVTYIHIALESHEVLLANGMLAESFWPGPQALRALSQKSALWLQVSAPQLFDAFERYQSAAPIIEGKLRKMLVNELRMQPGAMQGTPVSLQS